MASNIESVRAWLRTCPELVETNYFQVDYINDDPTCYAIYSSPSPISYKLDITGETYIATEQTQNFYFGVSLPFGRNISQNMANINALEQVIEWIYQQNAIKNYPKLTEGKVINIMPTLTPYPMAQGANAALYRISLQMKYRRI